MFASVRSLLIRSLQITSLVLVTIFSTSVALGQAQSNAANLQGFVKDQSGAVVANATVTARFPGTNVSRTTTTNDEGFYRLINLTPGDYDITVEAANFKKAVLSRVTVTVGQQADVDVTLEPGQITEIVTKIGRAHV